MLFNYKVLPVYLTVKNMSVHNQKEKEGGGDLKEEGAIMITVVQMRRETMGPKDEK